MSYKRHFARFLTHDQQRLHVAAHSHHPWPDVTFDAQQRAWLDAAALQDGKWDLLLGEVLPEASRHVAGQLGLPDPATITFAPSTHELVLRLLSCLPVPTRILTTDSEFHVVVDGYHGFMALPTDLAPIADRAFYLAGGYKYAMAGEGACFLHCPPGYGQRPVNTGWFAELAGSSGQVSYSRDASRFLGATFDVTGLYRFNAVQRLLAELGLSVPAIHAHVRRLQACLLDRLDALDLPGLGRATLVPPPELLERGNFLAFRLPDAAAVAARYGPTR